MMAEEKIIEAVRHHKELYDPSDANYMKTKLKNRIWCDIAKEVNFKDGEEAKNLWLKLRGGFRDARRRHEKCLKSGAAPQHIKPWKFQKQMSFLQAFMSTGPRESNLVNGSDDESHLSSQPSMIENSESQDVVSICNENEEASQLNPGENNILIDEERTPLITEERSDSRNDVGSRKRKEYSPVSIAGSLAATNTKKKKSKNDLRDVLNRSVEQREERARQRAEDRKKLLEETKNTDDPLFNFFMSMYQTTKSMPYHYQHKVRAQVFQTVSDAEADIININFNRPLSRFSSSHDSTASSNCLQPLYPTPLSAQQDVYMQQTTSTNEAHQMGQDREITPIDSNEISRSSLNNYINNYQCND